VTILLPHFALLDAEQLADQQKWLRVTEGGDRDSEHTGASVACHSEIANSRRDLAILGIVRASDAHPLRNANRRTWDRVHFADNQPATARAEKGCRAFAVNQLPMRRESDLVGSITVKK